MGKGDSPATQPQAKIKPALTGIDIQTSCEGLVIPVVYGQARISGNIIWMGALISTLHEGGGGDQPPEEPWPPPYQCYDPASQAYYGCNTPPVIPDPETCYDPASQSYYPCPPVV